MGPFFPPTHGHSAHTAPITDQITAPALTPSLCSLPHRLLSNNKITVLQNGSFFGLRALEKL